jgi:FimV-like protein
LQQLLALKNRVLMELQKHGIGGAPVATSGAVPAGAAQSVAGASAAPATSGQKAATVVTTSSGVGMSQKDLSIAAAVGAALVALLAALRMRRRKREGVLAAEAASDDGEVAAARASGLQDGVAVTGQMLGREGSGAEDEGVAERQAAALAIADRAAAERAAAEKAAVEREVAEREAAERASAERAAAEKAALEREAADREAAERASAERAAAEKAAIEREVAERAPVERAAAERASAEQAAAESAAAEKAAVERAAADRAAVENAAIEREAAERAAAEQAVANRAAQQAMAEPAAADYAAHADAQAQGINPLQPTHLAREHNASPASFDPLQRSAESALPHAQSSSTAEPLPAVHPDHFDSATTAASLAAAAELGAEALPLTSLEPVDESLPQEDPAHHHSQLTDEPATTSPATSQEPATEQQNYQNVPSPVIDFTQQHQQQLEPRAIPPFGQPYPGVSAEPLSEAAAHAQPAPAVPTEFPRDAVDAFGSLDMPLPPRIESPYDSVQSPSSLTTQPVASPETTAQQAFAPHEPDDAPHIADEIAAGTAGHAAVAGLGAAGFGALKLDFDLELPPSPAQPLPAFSQADLVRIARNKLDLASEYIELGDLAGARALINDVIEANDPATRTEARALLSTLAPLS